MATKCSNCKYNENGRCQISGPTWFKGQYISGIPDSSVGSCYRPK